MEKAKRKIILSIAGFDTSAGAGTLADIKTFQSMGIYGMAVVTALTLQSENKVQYIQWRKPKDILQDIEFLVQHYSISYFKIGIVKNLEMLNTILQVAEQQKIKVIWDPVLKTSTLKQVFQKNNLHSLINILPKIYCITPNAIEALELSGKNDIREAGKHLSTYTNVIIKGGHLTENTGTDYLFLHQKNKVIAISPQLKNKKIYPKHGSGCVFSSALTAYLTLGYSLKSSTQKAKLFTEKFLSSSKGLLGYY